MKHHGHTTSDQISTFTWIVNHPPRAYVPRRVVGDDPWRRSGEERLAHVLPLARAGRNGEDRRARELEVLHHRVARRHRVLQRDEVSGGVADERDEEEPGVEAAERVGAVDEVVAAAQHPHAAVLPWTHDGD